jgi:hypothetical protein
LACAGGPGRAEEVLARQRRDHLRLNRLRQEDDQPRRIGLRPAGCRETEGKDEQDYARAHRGGTVSESRADTQHHALFDVAPQSQRRAGRPRRDRDGAREETIRRAAKLAVPSRNTGRPSKDAPRLSRSGSRLRDGPQWNQYSPWGGHFEPLHVSGTGGGCEADRGLCQWSHHMDGGIAANRKIQKGRVRSRSESQPLAVVSTRYRNWNLPHCRFARSAGAGGVLSVRFGPNSR